MIKIKGLALPYNIANLHRETVLSGTLDKFLETWKQSGAHMPMLLQHEKVVGYWNAFANKATGLYLRGFITAKNINLTGMKLSPNILLQGDSRFINEVNLNRDFGLGESITLDTSNVVGIVECSLTPNPTWATTWTRKI